MANRKSTSDFFGMLSGPRLAFLAFIAAGGYFLWTEHQAHLLAALPYLILLLCPLMHVFMHNGHGGHGGHGEQRSGNDMQNREDQG